MHGIHGLQLSKISCFFNRFLLFFHDLEKSFQHFFIVFFVDFYKQNLSGVSESQFFLGQNLYTPVKLHIFF